MGWREQAAERGKRRQERAQPPDPPSVAPESLGAAELPSLLVLAFLNDTEQGSAPFSSFSPLSPTSEVRPMQPPCGQVGRL